MCVCVAALRAPALCRWALVSPLPSRCTLTRAPPPSPHTHTHILPPLPPTQGLSGDCTDNTVLLHSLAEVYAGAGEPAMAAGLLRRAGAHAGRPISASHADAMLRARLALGELVAAGGGAAREEAGALLKGVAEGAARGAAAVAERGGRGDTISSLKEISRVALERARAL